MSASGHQGVEHQKLDYSKPSHKRLVDEHDRAATEDQAAEFGATWSPADEAEANRQYQAYLDEEDTGPGAGGSGKTGKGGKGGGHAKGGKPTSSAAGDASRTLGISQASSAPASTAKSALGGMLRGRGAGGSVAGFLLGFGVYAVGLNFLRNGPAGARGWLSAKFFNEPWTKGSGTQTTAIDTALTGTPGATSPSSGGSASSGSAPAVGPSTTPLVTTIPPATSSGAVAA